MYSRAGEWGRANPDFGAALMATDWGALVRFAREASKMNQYGLADLLGLSQSAVARLESNAHPPTIRTLARVSAETRCLLEVTLHHPGGWLKDYRSVKVEFNGVRYAMLRDEALRARRLAR